MIKFALRLPEKLYNEIKIIAAGKRRSINSMILVILEEYIRRKNNDTGESSTQD